MDFDFSKEPGRKLNKRDIVTDGKPLISIITPYYNAGKYFEQTYNCVMNQTFPWFEWIIVDDGSTEKKSLEILDTFAETDERIKIFHKDNGGQSSARNLAIKESLTEYIIPLDTDDLIEANYIEVLYWALKKNPDYSFAYTNSLGFQDQKYMWNKPFDPVLMKTCNFMCYCSIIRKDSMEEVGYYEDTGHKFHEDWHLWLKMLSNSHKPVKVPNYGFWYRRTDTGAMSMVESDAGLKKKNSQLISQAGKNVDVNVRAKEYPYLVKLDQFLKPKLSNWNQKKYKKHDKTNMLMILPWLVMGGADIFNLTLTEKFNKDKYNLGIITTIYAQDNIRQSFAEYVDEIFELPNFLDIKDWPEFISYYIKSRKIDVIFLSNSYYGYYLMPWLRKNFPELVILDYVHSETEYWRSGGYARISGIMGEITEKTLTCNEHTQKSLTEKYGRDNNSISTLYIGVDNKKYSTSNIEYGRIRKDLAIEKVSKIVLFPCRIAEEKRPFLMLEIAKKFDKKSDKEKNENDIVFLVVGDGTQLKELKQKAKQDNVKNIYFAGRQDNMLPYYRDSNLTLICSLKEGLALTAYESLAMGVPVITSDVGGQKELVDEKVGAVLPLMQNEETDLDSRDFDEKEIEQYVDAIKNILGDENKYKKMSDECVKRIQNGFSTDIMIKKLDKHIEFLLTDGEIKEKRLKISEMLRNSGQLADEFLTLYSELENTNNNLDSVWRAKEYFRDLSVSENQNLSGENDYIKKELESIYKSRSWKLMRKYQDFANNNPFGRFCRRVCAKFYHLLKKNK